jgi:hypothetical protein
MSFEESVMSSPGESLMLWDVHLITEGPRLNFTVEDAGGIPADKVAKVTFTIGNLNKITYTATIVATGPRGVGSMRTFRVHNHADDNKANPMERDFVLKLRKDDTTIWDLMHTHLNAFLKNWTKPSSWQ